MQVRAGGYSFASQPQYNLVQQEVSLPLSSHVDCGTLAFHDMKEWLAQPVSRFSRWARGRVLSSVGEADACSPEMEVMGAVVSQMLSQLYHELYLLI